MYNNRIILSDYYNYNNTEWGHIPLENCLIPCNMWKKINNAKKWTD